MVNYFKITPRDRVMKGYLTWNENFDIVNYKKWWLHIKGIYRWLTGRTLTFKGLYKKYFRIKGNVSQMNQEAFYEVDNMAPSGTDFVRQVKNNPPKHI